MADQIKQWKFLFGKITQNVLIVQCFRTARASMGRSYIIYHTELGYPHRLVGLLACSAENLKELIDQVYCLTKRVLVRCHCQ